MPHRSSKTKQCRPEHLGLVISTTKKKRSASLNTTSFWTRLVVSNADQSATEEDCRSVMVKVHSNKLCNKAMETEFIL